MENHKHFTLHLLFITFYFLIFVSLSSQKFVGITETQVEDSLNTFIERDPSELKVEDLWKTVNKFFKYRESSTTTNYTFTSSGSQLNSFVLKNDAKQMELFDLTFVSKLPNYKNTVVKVSLEYDGETYFHIIAVPPTSFNGINADDLSLVSQVTIFAVSKASSTTLSKDTQVTVKFFHDDVPDSMDRKCVSWLRNTFNGDVTLNDQNEKFKCQVVSVATNSTECYCSHIWPDAIAIATEPSTVNKHPTESFKVITEIPELTTTSEDVIETPSKQIPIEENTKSITRDLNKLSEETERTTEANGAHTYKATVSSDAFKHLVKNVVKFPDDVSSGQVAMSKDFLDQFQTGTVTLLVKTSNVSDEINPSYPDQEQLASSFVTVEVESSAGQISFENTIDIVVPLQTQPVGDAVICRWLDNNDQWSSEGCTTQSNSDNTVSCSCNHLTKFAVFIGSVSNSNNQKSDDSSQTLKISSLPQYQEPKQGSEVTVDDLLPSSDVPKSQEKMPQMFSLNFAPGIGQEVALGITSINGAILVIFFICHLLITHMSPDISKSQKVLNTSLVNCVFSAVIGSCLLVNFINETGCEMKCRIFAVCSLYFMQCSVAWLSVYAAQTLQITRSGYAEVLSIRICSGFCYIIPFILALVSFLVINPNQLDYCFPPIHAAFIMIFPALSALAIASFFFLFASNLAGQNNEDQASAISHSTDLLALDFHRNHVFAYFSCAMMMTGAFISVLFRYSLHQDFMGYPYLFFSIGQNLALIWLFLDRVNLECLSRIFRAKNRHSQYSLNPRDVEENKESNDQSVEMYALRRAGEIKTILEASEFVTTGEEAINALNDHNPTRSYSVA